MPSPTQKLNGLLTERRLRRGFSESGPAAAEWSALALSGCLAELSGDSETAALTLGVGLVLGLQREKGTAVWLTSRESFFFPPDVAENGVDLEALPVVQVASVSEVIRAAEPLARSGAFDLIVLDLGGCASLSLPAQTRLASLAAHNECLVLCLTRKKGQQPSLGSLVALRGETVRTGGEGGAFYCRVRVLKDKSRGPGWRHQEVCHGPDGLR